MWLANSAPASSWRWPASRINGCPMVAKIVRTTVAEAVKGGCEGLFRATAGAYIFVGWS